MSSSTAPLTAATDDGQLTPVHAPAPARSAPRAARSGAPDLPGDPPITAMIARADVAAVAVQALVDPAARNKTVMLLNVAQPQVDGWRSAFAAIPSP